MDKNEMYLLKLQAMTFVKSWFTQTLMIPTARKATTESDATELAWSPS